MLLQLGEFAATVCSQAFQKGLEIRAGARAAPQFVTIDAWRLKCRQNQFVSFVGAKNLGLFAGFLTVPFAFEGQLRNSCCRQEARSRLILVFFKEA